MPSSKQVHVIKISRNYKINMNFVGANIVNIKKLLLNPQGGHLKIDAYLLNPVSNDFWRQIVTLFSSF